LAGTPGMKRACGRSCALRPAVLASGLNWGPIWGGGRARKEDPDARTRAISEGAVAEEPHSPSASAHSPIATQFAATTGGGDGPRARSLAHWHRSHIAAEDAGRSRITGMGRCESQSITALERIGLLRAPMRDPFGGLEQLRGSGYGIDFLRPVSLRCYWSCLTHHLLSNASWTHRTMRYLKSAYRAVLTMDFIGTSSRPDVTRLFPRRKSLGLLIYYKDVDDR
jgi:hypothetical protein